MFSYSSLELEETAKLRGAEDSIRVAGGKDCLLTRNQERIPLLVRLLATKKKKKKKKANANEEQIMNSRPRDIYLSL